MADLATEVAAWYATASALKEPYVQADVDEFSDAPGERLFEW